MAISVDLSHLGLYLGALISAGALYTFGLIVYRVFFHPLAKYPGPLLAKFTDAHQLYHAWKGDRHLEFWRMHQKHGKVYRFGPNSLSFDSNTGLKDIYGFRANVRKAPFYDSFAHPRHNTHNVRDKEVHARKRRVLAQAFSESAVKEMQRYVLNNVRTLCHKLGLQGSAADSKGWSQPIDIAAIFNYYAMDVLGDLCFGKAFRMLESDENHFSIELVEDASLSHLLGGTMPFLETWGITNLLFPRIAVNGARFMKYSKAQLTERTELGDETDRRDFFYYLLRARDPETGQAFTTEELWAESNLLLIAGSDTTSTSMVETLFYLTRNPRTLEKILEEIRSKFDNSEEIVHGPVLASCTYLRACIEEAMRMSPAVGGILPREVLPGGATIDGEAIPEGTVVGVPHYSLHHNELYFSNSFHFIPERWIAGAVNPVTGRVTSEDNVATANSAFCAFSAGPRGCIGKGLAYSNMTVTLARTLFLFDIRKVAGVADPSEGRLGAELGRHRVDEFQLKDIFTSSKFKSFLEFRSSGKQ